MQAARDHPVLGQLADHGDGAMAAALIAYGNDDGPCWALPPGEVVITRYDWTRHLTVPVAVFADRAEAEVELERLKTEEVELRASARAAGRAITRPNHWALATRW